MSIRDLVFIEDDLGYSNITRIYEPNTADYRMISNLIVLRPDAICIFSKKYDMEYD